MLPVLTVHNASTAGKERSMMTRTRFAQTSHYINMNPTLWKYFCSLTTHRIDLSLPPAPPWPPFPVYPVNQRGELEAVKTISDTGDLLICPQTGRMVFPPHLQPTPTKLAEYKRKFWRQPPEQPAQPPVEQSQLPLGGQWKRRRLRKMRKSPLKNHLEVNSLNKKKDLVARTSIKSNIRSAKATGNEKVARAMRSLTMTALPKNRTLTSLTCWFFGFLPMACNHRHNRQSLRENNASVLELRLRNKKFLKGVDPRSMAKQACLLGNKPQIKGHQTSENANERPVTIQHNSAHYRKI